MNEEKNSRKNIRYYLNHDEQEQKRLKKKFDYNAHNTHMFIEDFSRVVPYKLKDGELSMELVGTPTNMVGLVCNAFKYGNGYRNRDVERAFQGFINEVASNILYSGKAFYEIVYSYEENSGIPSSFSLERIQYEKVKEKRNDIQIYLPKRVAQEKGIGESYYISKTDIFTASFPQSLGGCKKIRNILANLTELSRMNLTLEALQNNNFGFDQQAYFYKTDLQLAQSTGSIKWDARGHYDKRITEYYKLSRLIDYKRAQRIFLDSILYEINKVLTLVGNQMNFSSKLEINGIPTVQEYDEMSVRLKDGEIGFRELVYLLI